MESRIIAVEPPAAAASSVDLCARRARSRRRLEIDNNAAERSLRGIAVGRKNWLFAGSDQSGHSATSIYSLVETAKLNGVEPEA